MLSNENLKLISNIFNGEQVDFFNYKSGPDLIEFFNNYFSFNDVYGRGFPSRWSYTVDKLEVLIQYNQINDFFTLILSKQFLMKEKQLSELEALVLSEKILSAFNTHLKADNLLLIKKDEKILLINEDDDLELVGEGGFALVYKRKSTGLVVKTLKEEFLTKGDIRSRFNREFEITKSLNEIAGIIEVYDFDENSWSYTMEYAELSLFDFISKNYHSYDNKITMLRQILSIMMQVHNNNIVHRDISPQNILIINSMLHISDFGLGKDLDTLHSHQTVHTNTLGQLWYCAPEQLLQLSVADKRSDVFSLGKLINFIFTNDPRNHDHEFRNVVEKATQTDPNYRHKDAQSLLDAVERNILYLNSVETISVAKDKIARDVYDEDVEYYIYNLTSKEICVNIDSLNRFNLSLIKFLRAHEKRGLEILIDIEKSFRNYCGRDFPKYDNFSRLAYDILNLENTSYSIKEVTATILNSIAFGANRFQAMGFVENLLNKGQEPTIEDILSRR